jgi:hypothetical protein
MLPAQAVLSMDQRRVDEMLHEEPRLQLSGSDHLRDNEDVGAVVALLGDLGRGIAFRSRSSCEPRMQNLRISQNPIQPLAGIEPHVVRESNWEAVPCHYKSSSGFLSHPSGQILSRIPKLTWRVKLKAGATAMPRQRVWDRSGN